MHEFPIDCAGCGCRCPIKIRVNLDKMKAKMNAYCLKCPHSKAILTITPFNTTLSCCHCEENWAELVEYNSTYSFPGNLRRSKEVSSNQVFIAINAAKNNCDHRRFILCMDVEGDFSIICDVLDCPNVCEIEEEPREPNEDHLLQEGSENDNQVDLMEEDMEQPGNQMTEEVEEEDRMEHETEEQNETDNEIIANQEHETEEQNETDNEIIENQENDVMIIEPEPEPAPAPAPEPELILLDDEENNFVNANDVNVGEIEDAMVEFDDVNVGEIEDAMVEFEQGPGAIEEDSQDDEQEEVETELGPGAIEEDSQDDEQEEVICVGGKDGVVGRKVGYFFIPGPDF